MAARGKVLVAMSGGVDSSVAAAMLRREGFDVVGVFMRLGTPGETLDQPIQACDADKGRGGALRIHHQGCCSISDAADARLVAAEIGVPFYVCNFRKDFGRIIDYFADEYLAGRTPNPCVRCNDWLKFGKLHEYARQLGCDFVASGHYARIEDRGGAIRLLRGIDRSKDQSYVLFGIPREQLGRTLLPIGAMRKSDVRGLARELGLPVFDKPDSQEICFVPDRDYAALVESIRPGTARAGEIVDVGGRVVGSHEGQHRFTIGQRRGVGVAAGSPLYVLDRDPLANRVVVGQREAAMARGCVAGEANWLTDWMHKDDGRRVLAKFRYNSEAVGATARSAQNAETGPTPSGRTGRFTVDFDEEQFAVAPGQAIVLYDGRDPDVVLGGGWIERVERGGAGS